MRPDELSPEMVELAKQAGIDVAQLSLELTDAELEAVVGGKDGGGFGGGGFGGGRGGYGGGRGGYGGGRGGYGGGRR